MTVSTQPDRVRLNDEEPSPDAMQRLSDALDAWADSVDPLEVTGATLRARQGTTQCRRCGWRWTPRIPSPRSCPQCHSAYWNVDPQLPFARRPEETDWDEMAALRRRRVKARRRQRHLQAARKYARELGLTLEDPTRPARVLRRTELVAPPPIPPEPPDPFAAVPEPRLAPMGPTQRPHAGGSVMLPYRRTVPPPPAMEDER